MKIAFVSSKGGHLGQIGIIFTPEVIGKNSALLITESTKKTAFKKEKSFLNRYPTYFFTKDELLRLNPFIYLRSFLKLYSLLRKEEVNFLVTNGAQLSIPAILAAKCLGIRTLFIDTIVRVKTPNWSARFCYPFADYFIVQHPEMIKKYGSKAIYRGGIL